MEFIKNAPEINKRQAEISAIREELAKLRAELNTVHAGNGPAIRAMIIETEMEALAKESHRLELAIKRALDENAEVSGIY